MTITALIVVNHENKIVTSRNPLAKISEVEDFIKKQLKGKQVIIDKEQYLLRSPLLNEASKVLVSIPEKSTEIVDNELTHVYPKTLNFLIKRNALKFDDMVLMLNPTNIMRIRRDIDRVIIITINNRSKEPQQLHKVFLDELEKQTNTRKLTLLQWDIKTDSANKNRYSIKEYC